MIRSASLRSFARLEWLFPIVVTAHNLEEAIWLPAFVAAHKTQLPWTVTAAEFRFAAAVLTTAAWIITWLSWRTGPQSMWSYLLFGYMVAMLANVVVPHVPAAFLFRGYSPGLITAVLLNLPVLTFLCTRAVREGYVSGQKAVAFAIGVPVLIVASVAVLFATWQHLL
ncbi:MAG: HXXEE domain-containing protein [Acidobacteriaceae bacterium]|nr:HXXEE domain-containing protein [Acidobacteriaceae bacterium]